MGIYKALLRLMTELSSRKWISKITGSFAQSSASRYFIHKFASIYEINVLEAEKPLHDYSSLNEFFTRKLKNGARPIDADSNTLISPVDALITSCGNIQAGTIFNVKGQDYTINDLLSQSSWQHLFSDGYYYVLYLSPTDYHRIHAPIEGEIIERQHLPGKVYPVNHFGMTNMKQVLSRNERLITYMQNEISSVAVVKVGAMNVSSINYVDEKQNSLQRGGELAYFSFGSTVVLLTQSNSYIPFEHITVGSKVKMGEPLGLLGTKSNND